MSKVVLVAGSETLLGRKLVEKELGSGNRVIAPVNSRKESTGGESSREDLLVLPWNRTSVFSTKAIIQESCRRWGQIDRAVIFDTALMGNAPFLDLTLGEMDESIDRDIKGTLYLTRELMIHFNKHNESILAFVRNSTGTSAGSVLEKACSGFFKDFSDRLLLDRENLYMCGFINTTTNVDIGAEYIREICESKPEKAQGEWLKISDKKSLFSSLPIEKRI